MSDIQELIHKTSMDCIEKGKRLERERIIKLLEEVAIAPLLFDDMMTNSQFKIPDGSDVVLWSDTYQALDKQLWHLIELIKGETNE